MLAPANMRVLDRRREAGVRCSDFILPPIVQLPLVLVVTTEYFQLGLESLAKSQITFSKSRSGPSRCVKLIEGMLSTARLPLGGDHNPTVIFWDDTDLASIKPRLSPNSAMLCQMSHKTNYSGSKTFL